MTDPLPRVRRLVPEGAKDAAAMLDRTRPRAEVILAPLTVRDVLLDEAGQWEDPDRLPEGFS